MSEDKSPEAVVALLSEAQRDVFSRLLGHSGYAFYPGAAHRACRSLAGLSLLAEQADKIGNPMFKFTELGQAVRALLQDNPS